MSLTVAALALRVRKLPPSCGPVRIVAIDGPSGAGKSTLARRLARAAAAQAVTSDDFPVPWDADPLVWWPPFAAEVLTPLSAGQPGSYRPYDWKHGLYRPRRIIAVAPVLIVEGVGAAAGGSPVAYRIWVDAPRKLRRRRVLRRDGSAVAAAWDAFEERAATHFAADRTETRADLILDGAALPAGQ
ncbi:hypothetical protein D5S18_02350 [Nocardia panacis]|uniref:(d)CMP kinase n=1 Tax=Nocardia panacis TaxID=2340916 RepID=A0A3A4KSU8_9NOCA|nr:(d)CMP kinase [Nocardia panacis]RJO79205.1 hypothetical protein D5S18_02350 [Nocardia panacis]